MSEPISIDRGDVFTISGLYAPVSNPARRWWQLWKPRLVASDQLQTFRVTEVSP